MAEFDQALKLQTEAAKRQFDQSNQPILDSLKAQERSSREKHTARIRTLLEQAINRLRTQQQKQEEVIRGRKWPKEVEQRALEDNQKNYDYTIQQIKKGYQQYL